MAKIGYARVSSADQNLDRQLKQLDNVENFSESISGASRERPQLIDFETDTKNSTKKKPSRLLEMTSVVKCGLLFCETVFFVEAIHTTICLSEFLATSVEWVRI